MKFKGSWLAISLAVVALGGCGGGGGGADSLVPSNAGGVTRIVAFGDSLSDPGAYALAAAEKLGGRFTVNSPGSRVWTELVAGDYGLPLLPNQVLSETGPSVNAANTSFAEGGSRITTTTNSPIEAAFAALRIPSGGVNGQKIDIGPGETEAQFAQKCTALGGAPSRFGLVPASATDANANFTGCVLPDSPIDSTAPAVAATAFPYPAENAGIGFFVSDPSTNVPVTLINMDPRISRSGITTLPVSKQVARYTAAASNADNAKVLATYLAGANDLFVLGSAINTAVTSGLMADPAVDRRADLFPSPTPNTTRTGSRNTTDQILYALATQIIVQLQTLVDDGIPKVLLGTIPDIGKTPFATGNGANPTSATALLFRGLTNNLNAFILAQRNDKPDDFKEKVQVLRLDLSFDQIAASPSGFSITNASQAACNPAGFSTSLRFPAKKNNSSLFCNQNDLVAANADDTYLFADGVHPTPRGHELIAEEALRVLRAARWR